MNSRHVEGAQALQLCERLHSCDSGFGMELLQLDSVQACSLAARAWNTGCGVSVLIAVQCGAGAVIPPDCNTTPGQVMQLFMHLPT